MRHENTLTETSEVIKEAQKPENGKTSSPEPVLPQVEESKEPTK